MTAKEARELSIKMAQSQIDFLKKEIEKRAKNGEIQFYANQTLKAGTIEWLSEMGYRVDDPNSFNPIISW
jgi:uncharacterized protein YfaT (DUF1175 family)